MFDRCSSCAWPYERCFALEGGWGLGRSNAERNVEKYIVIESVFHAPRKFFKMNKLPVEGNLVCVKETNAVSTSVTLLTLF